MYCMSNETVNLMLRWMSTKQNPVFPVLLRFEFTLIFVAVDVTVQLETLSYCKKRADSVLLQRHSNEEHSLYFAKKKKRKGMQLMYV